MSQRFFNNTGGNEDAKYSKTFVRKGKLERTGKESDGEDEFQCGFVLAFL